MIIHTEREMGEMETRRERKRERERERERERKRKRKREREREREIEVLQMSKCYHLNNIIILTNSNFIPKTEPSS